jgi:hypothetical protein
MNRVRYVGEIVGHIAEAPVTRVEMPRTLYDDLFFALLVSTSRIDDRSLADDQGAHRHRGPPHTGA